MGFYIEVPSATNKAGQLMKLYGADNIGLPPKKLSDIPKNKVLICVVQNGLFDAAGICYSEDELNEFKETRTGRKRTWLTMDVEKVAELKPAIAPYLRGEKDWNER